MNRTTGIMVALALLSAAGAWTVRPQPLPELPDLETGQLLFENFTDPMAASSLRVTSYDDESATVVEFGVEQKQGKWVIPSHNDYPADGTERMGKAAASFIGIKKDKQYGDRAEDHAAFGVLDPEGAEGKPEDRGQRIRISDPSGTTLVDVIVGRSIPDQQGMYYVRYPESKRVYGARLSLDISTAFSDWIEKDLLHVDRDELTTIVFDPYSVDEQQGRVVGSDPVIAQRDPDGAGDWALDPQMRAPSGKEFDAQQVKQVATAITNLKIVGVRPRPEQLTLLDLQSKGFFVAQGGPQPRLFGNEGQVSAHTRDGLVYTLYFGEITYETGVQLTAGVQRTVDGDGAPAEDGSSAAKDGPQAAEDGQDTTKTASRYLWVDVTYDETLDRTLAENTLFAGDDGEGADEAAVDGNDAADGDAQKKLQGQERAQKLRQRFDAWYYVISDASFKQIRKDRAELFKSPKAD